MGIRAGKALVRVDEGGRLHLDQRHAENREDDESGAQDVLPGVPPDRSDIELDFGPSPDLAASPMIGAVSRDGALLVGCAGDEASGSVCHALLNCLHVFVRRPAGPGEKKTFRYTIYFLENDIGELVRRAQADYRQYRFPPPEAEKTRLAGEGSVLASFEVGSDTNRIVAEKTVIESAKVRPADGGE